MTTANKMKKTPLVMALIMAGASLFSLSTFAADNGQTKSQYTTYYGGDIVTMERSQPTAEAVVASDKGKILFVGDKSDALKQFPASRTMDLAGKTLMPGFIEQHLHPVLAALTLSMPVIAPEEWKLPNKTWPAVSDHLSYIKALTHLEANMQAEDKASGVTADQQDILWSWGYNGYFHGDIDRDMLDKISSSRPMAIWHRSAHEFYLNSAMISRLKITQADIDKSGAAVAKQVNLEKGHFYESGFMVYLLPKIYADLASAERMISGLKQMVTLLHMRGVTAYNEPGAFIPPNAVELYKAILGAETTPMYSFFTPESKLAFYRSGKEGVAAEVEKTTKMFGSSTKVRFFDKQVKIMMDGAIISQLMQMKDGYLDGHHGEWIQTPEEVDAITKIFWEKGYQIHVHVNGDLGVEELIKILKKRQAEFPREDHRFTLVHFANSTDEQVRELKKLGVIISVNPYYVTGFGDKFGELGLGEQRAHSMVRLATIEKEQIPVSLHSDLPIAPSDPLYLAWSAATRHTNDGNTLRKDLSLSRDAALRGITIEAAYSWQMEESLGSIKTGKIANFTILEQNPYKVELDSLKDIQVYGTVFEGKLFPVKH
ncbi:amidohydrolase [Shewanella violacea]|uniref:Metal-dependent hydrolase, putative n=1 Tax=Shewanella violacea (strain JCM 10179 / CIP 106290 / LMG 19151 / DSS12) TaxID=637905 RepID=D4ZAR1_SHEVD|nr:amidohydrolase [Shewanella violacea]BAJ03106.1 metal-dependent hydrolase, putative [Shewanella violacea DSS12]